MYTFLCRCSWSLWWCNRKAAASWPTANIWFTAWQVWGNNPGGRHTRIPGSSGENHSQEGGVIMGHCHGQVCILGRLQHWWISSALLWPKTGCLPLRHSAQTQASRCGVNSLLLDVLSCLLVERVVWEVQCPDAAGGVQTNRERANGCRWSNIDQLILSDQ